MSSLDPLLASELALLLLGLILAVCLREQVQGRAVPFSLVAVGLALGVVLNTVLPEGKGFLAMQPGGLGPVKALFASALAVVILLPFFLFRSVRRMDMALLAMVGAFLGPNGVLAAAACSFLMAGVLALIVVLRTRSVGRLVSNLQDMLMSQVFRALVRDMPPLHSNLTPVPRVAFGIAIVLGTYLYLFFVEEEQLLLHFHRPMGGPG